MKQLIIISAFILASTTCLAQGEIFNFKNFVFDKKTSLITADSLLMFSNSSVELNYKAAKAGENKIIVKAKGVIAKEEWPIVEVKINNVVIGKQEVKSATFIDLSFTGKMNQGNNKIVVSFVNDAMDENKKEDRNLSLQYVEVK
ncbi:MAG: hypothetical protein K2Q18_12895 [Bdellovibrionales bacterium]|nr:hypothetical protein [Bdellovibrionales bacterium]